MRPHPHALRRILISFPAYESFILTFDEISRIYRSEVIDIGDPGHRKKNPHPLRVSADLYTELSTFMKGATDALNEGEDRRLPQPLHPRFSSARKPDSLSHGNE